MCPFFAKGNCKFGDKCRYDHVRPQQQRASPPARAYDPPPLAGGEGPSTSGGAGDADPILDDPAVAQYVPYLQIVREINARMGVVDNTAVSDGDPGAPGPAGPSARPGRR